MNSTNLSEETWLLPAQAANLLNVHPETVRRYAANGLIEFKRTAGRHRRYLESDIERLINDQSAGRVTLPIEASDDKQFSKETLFKFSSGLSVLLDSGMRSFDALPLAIQMSDSPELVSQLDQLSKQLDSHEYLSEVLATEPRFPETVIKLVAMGEAHGQLVNITQKMADFYAEPSRRET